MAAGRRVELLERRLADLDALSREHEQRRLTDIDIIEQMIEAELCAGTALRRVLPDEGRPVLPPTIPGRLKRLQALTGESGAAWRARVGRIGAAALASRNPADQAAVDSMLALVE